MAGWIHVVVSYWLRQEHGRRFISILWSSRDQGNTPYNVIEKRGSPAWDVSVVRQAATIPLSLEMQALIGCCVHQGVSPPGEANCWGLLVPRQGGQAAKLLLLSGGENPG